MKRSIKLYIVSVFLIIAPVLLVAQQPPHPNNGSNPNTNPGGNTKVGDQPLGAPVGDGTAIFVLLGLCYVLNKVNTLRLAKNQ
jgi:hypothetical protein